MIDPSGISEYPVGIFDSGVGGLSVLRAIHQLMPAQPTIYLADQAHVPYGLRPLEEVRAFSEAITAYLLEAGAKVIVVACNTASAAALHSLRSRFPGVPFVGMEPAVKPAAENTHTGVVGVLATPATFQGALYASVVERFAGGVRIIQNTCPGLVDQIEQGRLDSPGTIGILNDAIQPMLTAGIDTIVLGCTHYPFVIPQITAIAGEKVRVIDPAPAVAKQAARLLEEHGWLLTGNTPGSRVYMTSSEPGQFDRLAKQLIGTNTHSTRVCWDGFNLVSG